MSDKTTNAPAVEKPLSERPPRPIIFEAALSARGNCFTLDSEGEARLVLQVPSEFAKVLGNEIHRLFERTFIVRIESA